MNFKRLWRLCYKMFAAMGRPLPGFLHSQSNLLSVALRAYRPRPYGGRMVHFWAADRLRESLRQLEMEWSGVALGEVAFHEIQGDHSSMLRPPNVAALAGILAEYLKAEQSDAGLGESDAAGPTQLVEAMAEFAAASDE